LIWPRQPDRPGEVRLSDVHVVGLKEHPQGQPNPQPLGPLGKARHPSRHSPSSSAWEAMGRTRSTRPWQETTPAPSSAPDLRVRMGQVHVQGGEGEDAQAVMGQQPPDLLGRVPSGIPEELHPMVAEARKAPGHLLQGENPEDPTAGTQLPGHQAREWSISERRTGRPSSRDRLAAYPITTGIFPSRPVTGDSFPPRTQARKSLSSRTYDSV